jgi:hypothetical protein
MAPVVSLCPVLSRALFLWAAGPFVELWVGFVSWIGCNCDQTVCPDVKSRRAAQLEERFFAT